MKQTETQEKSLKFKPIHILYIAGIIFLFILAGNLRTRYLEHFQYIETLKLSAISLFSNVLNQEALLFFLLKHYSFQLFMGYFVSTLFLAVSIFLLYMILKDYPSLELYLSGFQLFKDTSDKIENGEENGKPAGSNQGISKKYKFILIAASMIIVALMIFTGTRCFGGTPINTDEFSYFFQANIIKSFKLYAPAPPQPEFFKFDNIIINNGKWYSKYTIGFPLILAVGTFFNFPQVINPIFSIISAIFIFLITKRLFGYKAAWISVLLAFISPFYFANGASGFQPHMTLACALLGAAYYYLLSLDKFRWHYQVLFAFFFTLGTLIRPVDGVLWAIGFFILSIWFLITRKDRGALFMRFLLTLGASMAGFFLILLVNKIQTGEFLKFAFHQFQKSEVWGFQTYGHNLYKAFWNLFYYQARIVTWSVVFFLESALISLLGKERRKALFLWFIYLVFVLFYFGWYTIGLHEYGPRYLFTAFAFLIPASSYGLSVIGDWMKKRITRWRTAQMSMLSILFLSAIFVVFPSMKNVFRPNVFDGMVWIRLRNRVMEIQKEKNEKMAIFTVYVQGKEVNNSNRNLYPVEDQKAAYFLLLEPEKDMEFLRKNYPGFKPYVAFCDSRNSSFTLEPFPSPGSMSPETKSLYYIFSGLTYRFTLNDPEKAKEAWLEAFHINEKNLAPLINMGEILMEQEKYDEAKKYWDMVLEKNPGVAAAYLALGRIAEKKGENSEAEKHYIEFIKRNPGSPATVKANERLLYYRKTGAFPKD